MEPKKIIKQMNERADVSLEYKKYKRYRQDIVAAVFESGFFVYRMGVLKIARND